MAHTRKDTYTKPREWAKHLRPWGKRSQAKSERRYASKEIASLAPDPSKPLKEAQI